MGILDLDILDDLTDDIKAPFMRIVIQARLTFYEEIQEAFNELIEEKMSKDAERLADLDKN